MKESKTCYRCRQEKELSEFIKCEKHIGGFTNLCKECKLEKQRIRRRLQSQEKKDRGEFNIRKKEPIPDNHKKKCTGCLLEKDFSEFHNSKEGKWGIDSKCRDCRKKISLSWRLRNSETVRNRQKNYRENHREEFRRYNRKYRSSDRGKEVSVRYRDRNRQKLNEYSKAKQRTTKYKERYKSWCKKNGDKIRKYGLSYWIKNTKHLLDKYRKRSQAYRDDLSNAYLKAYLKSYFGESALTKDIIEIKREQIKLRRKIKKYEKERNTINLNRTS